ncbi:hypothetical protein L3X38_021941 [Prunus dulcis]|uniref:Uncharacterized protein n=1 Tax=Prunus dulcis TaxID=3755 RepID=A0AAD4VV24_PRUDU|nr:hypothetical protein L3X38_021503 [Prunus dulcis]KAI5331815.1 hypothetical protein L3X38_021941 [Prunus dulcis]
MDNLRQIFYVVGECLVGVDDNGKGKYICIADKGIKLVRALKVFATCYWIIAALALQGEAVIIGHQDLRGGWWLHVE